MGRKRITFKHEENILDTARPGELFVFQLGTMNAWGTEVYKNYKMAGGTVGEDLWMVDPFYPIMYLGERKAGDWNFFYKFLVVDEQGEQRMGWIHSEWASSLGRRNVAESDH